MSCRVRCTSSGVLPVGKVASYGSETAKRICDKDKINKWNLIKLETFVDFAALFVQVQGDEVCRLTHDTTFETSGPLKRSFALKGQLL